MTAANGTHGMNRSIVNLPAVARITLGTPAAEAVAVEAERLGARRVFLLVSHTLATRTAEIDKIRAALGARYAGSHSGIRAHVPTVDVIDSAARARDANADLIVTVGGGSVTETGKVVLICLEHSVATPDRLDAFRCKFLPDGTILPSSYTAPKTPLICVPTTLSGGEFNTLAGVTDEATQRKVGFEHRALAPKVVVLDPALTVHTPWWLWASTGIRAVDHAVETLASSRSNAFCDGLADSALRLLARALPAVQRDEQDLVARLQCQVGAAQSILPLVSGVPMGASHAIGHLLGSVAGVPHGHTSCVMAPYVQAWNAEVPNPRLMRISECLGHADRAVGDLLDELIRNVGMPRTLAEVDVRPDQYRAIAEGTLHDIWGQTNPRPIESVDDVLELLRRASGGPGRSAAAAT